MPLRLKISACLAAVLALVFDQFWDFAKHQPALGNINPFANDPYDAVGSFAVLFAGAAIVFLLIRVFRPYTPGEASAAQQALLVRTAYAVCVAAAATIIADIIALLRHLSLWSGSSAGHALVALVGGMALLTLVVGLIIHLTARAIPSSPFQQRARQTMRWLIAGGVSLIAIAILAVYPESWTNIETTELLTVIICTLLLFLVMWVWMIALVPMPEAPYEDVIDDLAAMYRWIKAHLGMFGLALIPFEKLAAAPVVRLLVSWLNPRRYPYTIVLVALGVGALLAVSEAIGDPGPVSFALRRFAIFVGLGGGGVILGYLFLARPLGIFRRDASASSQPAQTALKKG